MIAQSRQALVADIGGTNARFAIADIDELVIDHFASFSCRMFSSLEEVLKAYLVTLPKVPPRACLAVAAPLRSDVVTLTNLHWSFTADSLRAASGIRDLRLVNDFEALALTLPHLVSHDLHPIGGGVPSDHLPKVVLGPGTGLGMAGLVRGQDGWVALASEGGHVTFAAETDEEVAIVRHMIADHRRVSAERLISGPGVEQVYRILAELRGSERQFAPVSEIFALAAAGKDAIASDTVEYFLKWLGRFAGDMALAYGAGGGVYVAGGIAPRILTMLENGVFRQAFCDKGRMSEFVESVPLQVLVAPDAGLRGAALAF